MSEDNAPVGLDHLNELAEILEQEERALRKMDASQVLLLSERKLEWLKRNSQSQLKADPALIELLGAMRERALKNQLLLVHARDLLHGMIQAQAGLKAMGRGDGRARLLEVKG